MLFKYLSPRSHWHLLKVPRVETAGVVVTEGEATERMARRRIRLRRLLMERQRKQSQLPLVLQQVHLVTQQTRQLELNWMPLSLSTRVRWPRAV